MELPVKLIAKELQIFEARFKEAARSQAPLLDRIMRYIVNERIQFLIDLKQFNILALQIILLNRPIPTISRWTPLECGANMLARR